MQLKKFKSIGFIGGGRITRIFLEAFRRKEVVFESVLVNDLDTEKLNLLKKQFPYIETVTQKEKPAECDLVVLALHPQDIICLTIYGNIFQKEQTYCRLHLKCQSSKLLNWQELFVRLQE